MRFAASLFPLLVWIIWVGIVTLFPFDFGTFPGRGFFEPPLSTQLDDIPLNVLLFIPLGAWLSQQSRDHLVEERFVLILAVGAGALSSLSVECLQLFLPSRFPQVVDIVVNTLGAVVGVYVHRRWATAFAAFATRLRKSTSGGYVVVCMAIVAVTALVASATLIATMNAPARLDELERYKLTYVAGLFVLPGTLVYVLCGSWRTRLMWSGFWVFGFPLLFEATLVFVSGRPFDFASVATTASIGALVFSATLVIPWGLTEGTLHPARLL